MAYCIHDGMIQRDTSYFLAIYRSCCNNPCSEFISVSWTTGIISLVLGVDRVHHDLNGACCKTWTGLSTGLDLRTMDWTCKTWTCKTWTCKTSTSSKSSTHYPNDTNRLDVSSKGPLSGIHYTGYVLKLVKHAQ